eukprot:CAMPEP_0198199864 /NCGR_PEP_ID=MMETSP1445-20131203/2989_1 /TAXON_ID=36898 /ORGANISM="Pyramimonas sp., Strain CCMP2087" /LENGTH=176 /DNA_ID=CAMNT_0043869769 /DNA_START=145 /DNA_END=675 /DNA_ORIENTATION=-
MEGFHSYRYCEVWGGNDQEAVAKVYDFFETEYFKEQMETISGALEVLQDLQDRFRFVVVTSRQNIIQDATREWIEKFFPGIFEEVLFGNHWTKDSPNPDDWNETKRTKLEMCQSIGAICLVDDSVTYAKQCAPFLKKVVLFGKYGWNTKDSDTSDLPESVARADDWTEVGRILGEL